MKNNHTRPLRVVFMGTPDFAIPSLQSLIDSEAFDVVGVYTQPPRPANRGKRIRKSPVHILAESHSIPVLTPKKLTEETAFETFQKLSPDVCVVVAYGAILRDNYLNHPPHGCVNVHGSLLPRWRGASPIHAAIINGDTETGITLMEMVRGLDAGAMIAHVTVPITSQSTTGDLHDVLCEKGAALLRDTLAKYCEGAIPTQTQDESHATFCTKLTRDDGRIDWTESMAYIDRHIRANSPWPCAFFCYKGENIKVLKACVVPSFAHGVGEISPDGTAIQGVDGALRLEVVQRPSKSPQPINEFLRGFAFTPGTHVS